jgi:hypothetical protein
MSLNDLKFSFNESNSNNGALLALHDSCGWLADIYALLIISMLVNKYH